MPSFNQRKWTTIDTSFSFDKGLSGAYDCALAQPQIPLLTGPKIILTFLITQIQSFLIVGSIFRSPIAVISTEFWYLALPHRPIVLFLHLPKFYPHRSRLHQGTHLFRAEQWYTWHTTYVTIPFFTEKDCTAILSVYWQCANYSTALHHAPLGPTPLIPIFFSPTAGLHQARLDTPKGILGSIWSTLTVCTVVLWKSMWLC